MLWGGQRLRGWFGEVVPPGPIGEAWLVSDHPHHVSRVAAGPYAGATLRELMLAHAEALLGKALPRFPLLIKLLDASENLSLQVHPDDEAAATWAPSEGGKTEAWLVLEADPNAGILLGLKPGIDKQAFARELQRGTAALCLRRFEPRPGEWYYVPAGTVHALGGGLAVLEVQQTSDATFRLYDWDRVDTAGKRRPLHVEAGLACTKEATAAGRVTLSPAQQAEDAPVLSCPAFSIRHLRPRSPLTSPPGCVIISLGGDCAVSWNGGDLRMPRGLGLLVPAGMEGVTLSPTASPFEAVVVQWRAAAAPQ